MSFIKKINRKKPLIEMTLCDELVEIKQQNWPELRNMYLKDWPKNAFGYYTVNNYIKWKQKDQLCKEFIFFSLNGDWSDGTYIVMESHLLFPFTMNSSTERLERLAGLLPLNRNYMLPGIQSRFVKALYKVVEQRNWVITNGGDLTYIYRMSKEDAIKFEVKIPDDVTLRPLSAADINVVDSLYPHDDYDKLNVFRKLQKFNLSLGLFDEENNLLAWCMHHQTGQLTALQTHERAKRCGLASVIVKAMAHELAKSGYDCMSGIITTNTPCIKLFEKLGFEKTGEKCIWSDISTVSSKF